MMRAIVFATVVSMLIIQATCWRDMLRDEEESELPKQVNSQATNMDNSEHWSK